MSEEITISPLDTHFAALMVRLNGRPDAVLQEVAQTASAWRAAGHVCLPLAAIDQPGLAKKLRATRVVGQPGEFKPLILDEHDRLYLQRYWAYEAALGSALLARVGQTAPHDPQLLAEGLRQFFGEARDPQARAAATAIERSLCVITGGPGTGKTRTVVVILALLSRQFAASGRVPRVALAAPTGKAGARLKESIEKTAEELNLPESIRAAMPPEATTIHRLLGAMPNSPYFRHGETNPLAVDAVIVDEASMVDLSLMAKLIAAVPPEARLILLGDKDQLASVEAGYVLGDIAQPPSEATVAPIREHIVELTTNYRFGADSGIYRASRAVNQGDAEAALATLRIAGQTDLKFAPPPPSGHLEEALRELIVEGYRGFLMAQDPREALEKLSDFRVLCALRRGPWGVENLNRVIEQILTDARLIEPTSPLYKGRPVLVLQNDPQLKLFNGDLGLLLPDPEAGGALRACFLESGGTVRRLLPARLPRHETAFAMTVHKSQGSEFNRVLLVLPERDSPVVTRELVYTGLTRARSAVELWADEALLRLAINRRTQRTSGLRDKLWPK